MRFYIQDNVTGRVVNVTELVVDALELGISPNWNSLLVTEGIQIAACVALDHFGHDQVDAYTDREFA